MRAARRSEAVRGRGAAARVTAPVGPFVTRGLAPLLTRRNFSLTKLPLFQFVPISLRLSSLFMTKSSASL